MLSDRNPRYSTHHRGRSSSALCRKKVLKKLFPASSLLCLVASDPEDVDSYYGIYLSFYIRFAVWKVAALEFSFEKTHRTRQFGPLEHPFTEVDSSSQDVSEASYVTAS